MISSFTAGSLLLGLALALVVILLLARPFLQPVDENFETEEQIESLLAQKEALLQDLRSLDSDMEAGKVAPELYAHDRPLLMKRAALVLQQLDRLGYVDASIDPTALSQTAQAELLVSTVRSAAEVNLEIEAAILSARDPAASALSPADASVTTGQVPAKSFCSRCGTPVDRDDRFCAGCGNKLIGETQTTQAA